MSYYYSGGYYGTPTFHPRMSRNGPLSPNFPYFLKAPKSFFLIVFNANFFFSAFQKYKVYFSVLILSSLSLFFWFRIGLWNVRAQRPENLKSLESRSSQEILGIRMFSTRDFNSLDLVFSLSLSFIYETGDFSMSRFTC